MSAKDKNRDNKQFEIQENIPTFKPGNVFMIKKVHFFLGLVLIAFIFAGSILATYFGKPENVVKVTVATPQVATTVSPTTSSSTVNPPIIIDYRLPKNLKPYLYDLTIKPFLGPQHGSKAFTFEGTMIMYLNCTMETNKIVFHQENLKLDEENVVLIDLVTNSNLTIKKPFEYRKTLDFVTVNLNQALIPNRTYSLKVPYSANLSTSLVGFYIGSYVVDGKTHYLASTDFEPTDARSAFPCFDEPDMKSKFKLTVIRPKELNAQSNSLLTKTTVYDSDSNWEVDYFDESVPMSTYLMAFVVSDFKKINKTSPKHNVLIEVSARPQAIDNGEGDFGLEEAAKIIDFFSDYFQTKYPLPKSTQVAVPNFNSGAMENWGLVIYREASLLYNPKTDTIANKKRVSVVVSHELAHQWFGNLVTMKWWNDLWLNEGFASWVEYLGYNHTHPEWRQLDFFLIDSMSVMVKDSYESSHPISVTVNDPKEIGSLFDSISYNKGAAIIRMMNAFLTEETFRLGVSSYLKNNSFNNAEQDDLWQSLTEAAHENKTLNSSLTVKEIMDTWTLQKGYPVVSVHRNTASQITVEQKWFLLNPESKVKANQTEYNKYKWYVPFTFTTKAQSNFNFESRPVWLKPSDISISVNLADTSDWYIANMKRAGFYRVNYDNDNWNKLIEQLKTDYIKIEETSRGQLLDDSFNLGRAQYISQTLFLDMTSYLGEEKSALPFQAAFYGLDFISDMLSSDKDAYDLFKSYYLKLVEKQYSKLGWMTSLNDTTEIDLQLNVLRIMCKLGSLDCLKQARTYYNDWIIENKPIPSNFKSIVYQTVIANGDKNDWNTLYQIALETTNPAEKLRILRALSYSTDYETLKFYLAQTKNENVVKSQDETTILTDIGNNIVGRRLVLDYIDAEWNYLITKYGSVSFTLPNLFSRTFSKLNTEFELKILKKFSEDKMLGIAAPAYKELVETVDTNVNWMQKNLNSIKQWLKVQNGESSSVSKKEYRLPTNLEPYSYEIFVQPYFKLTTKPEKFKGTIKINFKCVENTNRFVIHMNNITLTNYELTSLNDTLFTFKNFNYSYDEETNLLTAVLNSEFKSNNSYVFYADYQGKYFNDNKGFYANVYKNNMGENNYLVSSQFEPVEARRAFPSFDEPAYKAKFKIKVKHDISLKAISNMPILEIRAVGNEDGYDLIETEFEETLTMSTYLVALVVADFKCIDNQVVMPISKQTVNSSTCTRPNAMDQIKLASDASLGLLQFYEQYYNTIYPFPKLDHISTPDFAYGAMENWGLAIYKESNFLFKEYTSSQAVEQNVVRIVSHEISHQWFGNIVTPKWWDDLWLNEGFARYMEYLGTAFVRPDWGMIDQHLNILFNVFQADSEETIRPLSPGIVNTQAEIDAMVDSTITYGKGSAVVRMLNYILGEKTYINGLSAYFEKFKYRNVDQYDLWKALNQQANDDNIKIAVNLTEAMRKWTKQRGHPVVTFTLVNSTHAKLSQKRFVLNSTTKYEALKDFEWHIPFSYSIGSIGSSNQDSTKYNSTNVYDQIIWLQPGEDGKIIQLSKTLTKDDFVLGNLDAAGYFRVNYDENNWLNIISQLKTNKNEISRKVRAQLLSDVYNLAQAKEINSLLPLKLSDYLINEDDFLPWNVFLSRSKFYIDMLEHTRFGEVLNRQFAKLTKKYFEKFDNWTAYTEKETWLDRIIKVNFVQFACLRGLPECVTKAREYYNTAKTQNDLTLIPAMFRPTVYCMAVRYGDESEFDYLLDNLFIQTDRLNKTNIIYGLSCSKDVSQLSRLLYKVTANATKSEIDLVLSAIRNVAIRANGNNLAWSFTKKNWERLYIDSSASALTSVMTDIINKFNTQDEYEDFVSFFNKNNKSKIDNSIETARLRIKSYVNWFKKSETELDSWATSI